MRTGRALIIVDVQPTFCEGGELPVAGGNAVAEAIAGFVVAHRDRYDLVVTTQDWHINPGGHFSDHPDFVDSWPAHGVAGTPGADLHPALAAVLADNPADVSIRKGVFAAAYSGFDGTDESGRRLELALRAAGVRETHVVGIAESHCVKATALDARACGFDVVVLSDLTVPVTPELGAAARAQMLDHDVVLRRSDDQPVAFEADLPPAAESSDLSDECFAADVDGCVTHGWANR